MTQLVFCSSCNVCIGMRSGLVMSLTREGFPCRYWPKKEANRPGMNTSRYRCRLFPSVVLQKSLSWHTVGGGGLIPQYNGKLLLTTTTKGICNLICMKPGHSLERKRTSLYLLGMISRLHILQTLLWIPPKTMPVPL